MREHASEMLGFLCMTHAGVALAEAGGHNQQPERRTRFLGVVDSEADRDPTQVQRAVASFGCSMQS